MMQETYERELKEHLEKVQRPLLDLLADIRPVGHAGIALH